MKKPALLAVLLLFAAACSPARPTDPRAAAGTWPPKDYAEFAARPPMSVGAELDDDWTMAIEAERWSYQIGVALVALGGTPPAELGAPPTNLPERTLRGLRNAAKRLSVLQAVSCGQQKIAKADDCVAFAEPEWFAKPDPSIPSKDELQARLQWFQMNAEQFILPACEVAIKRTGDERYCAVE